MAKDLVAGSFLLLLVLILIKTILFIFLKSRKWTFMDFIFFSRHHFFYSGNAQREIQKRILNILSILIFLLTLIILFQIISMLI